MLLKYEDLDSPLSIYFHSNNLDLLQIGILGSEIHKLLNQVAISLIEEHNKELDAAKQPLIDFHLPLSSSREDVLIRANVSAIRQGSIELEVAAVMAQVFSVPGAGAIVQNLMATAIWAIGEYAKKVVGCRITKQSNTKDISKIAKTSSRRRLGPIVERVLKELKASSNGGEFRMKSGDEEIEIKFYSNTGPQ